MQRFAQAGVVDRQRRGTGHHDQIDVAERLLFDTEDLTHQALESVAVDRTAYLFLRDRQAQAGPAAVGPTSAEYREPAVCTALGTFEDAPELDRTQQP